MNPKPPASAPPDRPGEGTVLRFGIFEVDLRNCELRKGGVLVKLQQQPFRVLALLVSRPGDVVTREELRDQIWGGDTFVDFDQGMNFCIKQIRVALGDQADTPRYVETLPRRGYRFIAPLERRPLTPSPEASLLANGTESLAAPPRPLTFPLPQPTEITRVDPGPPAPPRRRAPTSRRAGVAAVLALVVAGAYLAGRRAAQSPSPAFHRLTFRRGFVDTARFTPEGEVVYSAMWEGGPAQTFATRAGSADTRTLGYPKARVQGIAGTEMALLVPRDEGLPVLSRAPLAGGPPREILEDIGQADWAPDGSVFAIVRRVKGFARLEFPVGRVLFETVPGRISHLRVSPRLDRVAFLEHPVPDDDRGSVVTIDRDGLRTTLSSDWASLEGLAFSPSGDEVWFTGTKVGADLALYAVSLKGRERLVHRSPGRLVLRDIGRDGRVLLARHTFRLEIRALIDGEESERDLTWFELPLLTDLSEDARQIVFCESGDAGGPGYGVFVRATDGSPPVRLGDGRPFGLSPDGKWVLSKPVRPPYRLVMLPTGAGESRVLKDDGLQDIRGVEWFPDGRRLLITANEAGRLPRMWVQDLDGGKPRAVTPEGTAGKEAVISPDGGFVVAFPNGAMRGMRYPVDGGEPQLIPGLEDNEYPVQWTDDGTLYARKGGVPAKITRIDVGSGQREVWKELAPRDPAGVWSMMRVLLTRDGTSYAYGFSRSLSELYLVEGLK
jgi:DNA-binding winged helix-turn-helix (wHTH) protein/sugar lactone lactonase YvrE